MFSVHGETHNRNIREPNQELNKQRYFNGI